MNIIIKGLKWLAAIIGCFVIAAILEGTLGEAFGRRSPFQQPLSLGILSCLAITAWRKNISYVQRATASAIGIGVVFLGAVTADLFSKTPFFAALLCHLGIVLAAACILFWIKQLRLSSQWHQADLGFSAAICVFLLATFLSKPTLPLLYLGAMALVIAAGYTAYRSMSKPTNRNIAIIVVVGLMCIFPIEDMLKVLTGRLYLHM